MNPQTLLLIVSYVTAGLVLVVGIAVLAGPLIPAAIPGNMRVITGVVMVLYGTYRIAMLLVKTRNARKYDEQ